MFVYQLFCVAKYSNNNVLVGRFSLVCSRGANSCLPAYISLYSSIWPDAYYVLYWSLFFSWFFIGHECQSTRNCLKANVIRNEPADISPNMGFYSCSAYLHNYPVELLEQVLLLAIKALDTFNTAIVSPIYYVMFTSFTILASVIMFKDWDRQNPTQIVTEMCGFVTILSGTFLLHKTKDMADGSMRLSKHTDEEDGFGQEGIPLRRQDSLRSP
ncbi:hypothetical protein RHGRI_014220 [Rhododendron griersonianum]|uniref:Probable magnesium transporter n=1 Tax=Rhododendron griersonianum TaxID=479676 RepID=A0AAV6K915_9ERIC|nr:hypothetical protein RHGRI_014220 [Rhododendron griersonianum]